MCLSATLRHCGHKKTSPNNERFSVVNILLDDTSNDKALQPNASLLTLDFTVHKIFITKSKYENCFDEVHSKYELQ